MNVVRIINQLITPGAYNVFEPTFRTPKYAQNLNIVHSGIPWWWCKQILKSSRFR